MDHHSRQQNMEESEMEKILREQIAQLRHPIRGVRLVGHRELQEDEYEMTSKTNFGKDHVITKLDQKTKPVSDNYSEKTVKVTLCILAVAAFGALVMTSVSMAMLPKIRWSQMKWQNDAHKELNNTKKFAYRQEADIYKWRMDILESAKLLNHSREQFTTFNESYTTSFTNTRKKTIKEIAVLRSTLDQTDGMIAILSNALKPLNISLRKQSSSMKELQEQIRDIKVQEHKMHQNILVFEEKMSKIQNQSAKLYQSLEFLREDLLDINSANISVTGSLTKLHAKTASDVEIWTSKLTDISTDLKNVLDPIKIKMNKKDLSQSNCPSDYDLRLVGGTNNVGRVEIFYKNAWGTICDKGWELVDGGVVCRDLGYRGALNVHNGAKYGQGAGKVIIEEVECKGKEKIIPECLLRYNNWDRCNHTRDASVECY